MKSIYVLKPYKDRLFNPLAGWLQKRRCSANQITATGLVAGLFAAFCLWKGLPGFGVAWLAISVIMDLLDGTIARLEPVTTIFGKFLDGISDRVVESAWVAALILNGTLGSSALALPIGSIGLLICRILAYQYHMDSSVVTVTRFERITALLAVVVLPWQTLGLGIYGAVTIGTFFSCFQIIRITYKTRFHIKPVHKEALL